MSKKSLNTLYVEIGDGVVVIRREGNTASAVAKILGSDAGADGEPKTLWLDRLVHREDEDWVEGWIATGPYVTRLDRAAASSPYRG
jgi:hypothetical protein